MAYVVGLVSSEEKAKLEADDWEVESAYDYDLVGDGKLIESRKEWEADGLEPVVIFVDSDVLDVIRLISGKHV